MIYQVLCHSYASRHPRINVIFKRPEDLRFVKSYLLEVKHLFFEVGLKSFGIQATIVNGASYAEDTIKKGLKICDGGCQEPYRGEAAPLRGRIPKLRHPSNYCKRCWWWWWYDRKAGRFVMVGVRGWSRSSLGLVKTTMGARQYHVGVFAQTLT